MKSPAAGESRQGSPRREPHRAGERGGCNGAPDVGNVRSRQSFLSPIRLLERLGELTPFAGRLVERLSLLHGSVTHLMRPRGDQKKPQRRLNHVSWHHVVGGR